MKSQRGGFLMGLVAGLLIGLAVALGVALYITKAPVPFINKVPQRSAEQDAAEAERNKNWDPNAPLAGKTAAKPQAAASAEVPGTPAPAASAVVANPAAPASAATAHSARDPAAILAGQAPAASAAGKTAAAPAAKAASAVTPAFFVQAGAYGRTEDAEAQRAKLALMGLSAKITEREQSGRTVYRVRIGPLDTREEAEDIQTKLTNASIESNLVRVER